MTLATVPYKSTRVDIFYNPLWPIDCKSRSIQLASTGSVRHIGQNHDLSAPLAVNMGDKHQAVKIEIGIV